MAILTTEEAGVVVVMAVETVVTIAGLEVCGAAAAVIETGASTATVVVLVTASEACVVVAAVVVERGGTISDEADTSNGECVASLAVGCKGVVEKAGGAMVLEACVEAVVERTGVD